jgi:hypothetical protein
MSVPGIILWLLTVFLSSGVVPLAAQWIDLPQSGPKTKDGRIDLKAPVPLAADGEPDLSGLWAIDAKGFSESLSDYVPGGLPMQLWAQALLDERQLTGAGGVPTARCLPPSIPMLIIGTIAHPMKIIQQRGSITMLYEYFGGFRQVYLDGRKSIKDPNPTWMGYSTGFWNGKDLVVETTGFNGRIWLGTAGHPATDALHLSERFTRVDYGHMTVRMTIDDPQAYTKPWTAVVKMHLVTEGDLIEYVCNENERDTAHTR